MSALAMAMLLTGAGAVQDHKPPSPLPPLMPMIAPPAPPSPRRVGPPPPRTVAPPRRVRANLNSYISMDDYPASALRANEQGTASVRLVIGPNGRVIDCLVTASSGSSALDQATCRIMRSRARYVPARDSQGNPTTGTDAGRISWRLSVDERAGIPHPERPAPARAGPGGKEDP